MGVTVSRCHGVCVRFRNDLLPLRLGWRKGGRDLLRGQKKCRRNKSKKTGEGGSLREGERDGGTRT